MVMTDYSFSTIINWMFLGSPASPPTGMLLGTGSSTPAYTNTFLDSGISTFRHSLSSTSGLGATAQLEYIADSGDIFWQPNTLINEIGMQEVFNTGSFSLCLNSGNTGEADFVVGSIPYISAYNANATGSAWTIEFWGAMETDRTQTNWINHGEFRISSNIGSFTARVGGTALVPDLPATSSHNNGSPHHFALSYSGNTTTNDGSAWFYIDGIMRSSGAGLTLSTAADIAIGGNADGGVQTNVGLCRITEIKYSKTSRYTGSDFSVNQSPFIEDANTLGLWHINDLSGSVFSDASIYMNSGFSTNGRAGFGSGLINNAIQSGKGLYWRSLVPETEFTGSVQINSVALLGIL